MLGISTSEPKGKDCLLGLHPEIRSKSTNACCLRSIVTLRFFLYKMSGLVSAIAPSSLSPTTLNDLHDRFKKSETVIRDIKSARIALQRQKDELVQESQFARAQITRTKMKFESIRKRIYKEASGATAEQSELLVTYDDAHNNALKYEKSLIARKQVHIDAVRDAEVRACDLLGEIQSAWLATCCTVSPPAAEQGPARALSQVLSEMSHPRSPPITIKLGKPAPQTPTEQVKHGLSHAQPILEDEGEVPAALPDKVDALIKAGGNLTQRRQQLQDCNRKLQIHQLSYKLQFKTYSKEQEPRKIEEAASAFGSVFMEHGRAIFLELRTTEELYETAKLDAKAAGIPAEIVEYPDEDAVERADTTVETLKRKVAGEDLYDPSRIIHWLDDSERPRNHKRRFRLDADEASQLFVYKPLGPNDGLLDSFEACPKRQKRLESHKKEVESNRKQFVIEKESFDIARKLLNKDHNIEELVPDATPNGDNPNDVFDFSAVSVMRRWDNLWELRRRSTEARSRKRRGPI
jgi:predicted transcriptional regulator